MKVSPRSSVYTNGNKRDTMGSVYSIQPPPPVRQSYIAGAETDEEEQQTHNTAEVLGWSPARVAEYLEDNGVEKSHCDVFIEQEISGEVLLAMDQNSLFIKEFDLGSVGRRLRTWHKIKALQDEVKRSTNSEVERRSVSDYSAGGVDESQVETGRNRSSTMGSTSLPRALTTKRNSGDNLPVRSPISKRESFGISPLQSMTSMSRPENTHRPSAQGIRNLNHSRRHSSIDSTSTDGASRIGHRKQPSVDQKWQPGVPANGHHAHTASIDSQMPQRQPSAFTPASPGDLDRGYFSSNEVESKSRRTLTKRNSTTVSPIQSRNGSILGTQPHRVAEAEGYRDPVSPVVPASHHFNSINAVNSRFGGYRSATTPGAMSQPNGRGPITPVVTKLDHFGKQSSLSAIAASPTAIEDNASEASSDKPTPSPSTNTGFFSSARAKVAGLRSTSDAVTRDEKVVSPSTISSRTRTETGSSTPSTEHPSLDMKSRESTGSGNNLMPPQPTVRRPRAKSKKSTSAYTRGLEKKSPAEQMIDCDYSGWMKKKSSSLVATWKPRLFILRGRRLSYYYSDGDEEEKGLIDISFHRVLPAHDEKLTAALASMTGAGAGSASPTGSTPTIAQQDLRNHPPKQGESDDSLFIFKLVPPKAGLAKGVNFTKPTVHYFAVNSRQEGRLWMAALMKATIDRDDNGVVTTTYNQKTISLAKARARRERPPALKEEGIDEDDPAELDAGEGGEIGEKGLGIGGLNDHGAAVAGADENKTDFGEDASSITPSTFNTVDNDLLSEQEKQAIALDS